MGEMADDIFDWFVEPGVKGRSMGKIEYLERKTSCSKKPLECRLDGKICGEIRKVIGGYQYFPKGQKIGGNIFKTITEVQKSLDEEMEG